MLQDLFFQEKSADGETKEQAFAKDHSHLWIVWGFSTDTFQFKGWNNNLGKQGKPGINMCVWVTLLGELN